MQTAEPKTAFTTYEKAIIGMLAFIQFTVILDFMVLSPLGAQLLAELNITTAQFGWVVSAYAFSAGTAGLLTAGFADRYDRKKLLLFFYSGFVIGTLLCGIAPDYHFLLVARIITGLFGGVIGSIGFAIVTDLFAWQVRGRVMGVIQTAFAASQVLGIPLGLYLANNLGWHAPFLLIVGVSVLVGIAIVIYMKPVNAHLKLKSDRNPFQHLLHTVSRPSYLRGFASTTLLATGGFMMMPFGSAFAIFNLGISQDELPLIYMVTGISAIIIGPLAGKLSDKIGKFPLFLYASLWGMLVTIVYCNLGITPLWQIMVINVLLFAGISARMVSSGTLVSAVPDPQDRGAYMGINSSVQQISGGIASLVAGMIVVQSASGRLERYDWLGYIVAATMLVTIVMMYSINQYVTRKQAAEAAQGASLAGGPVMPTR
ncbi:putative MFS family arabinose efflux permease [Larkinella arboricola]|uniref:Putative MFS family arabinose efflux permease n=1 Tax=Larkinella arboricola TaxID=643671 RepID=A0A327WU08_LARAB|nr:MFS transporter [Larkinella arboricola]RAJ96003.1 putative MFS family arabinose efflux permease [Larkinella arboricola]